ncbi:E3 ubiquitin-protein ligase RNF149-like [Juglans microcarpa x Juglans regia]|uniref:E3 ubiquitin-protein ligase RNF149-like n=1 Tax=Juglans microcarpa x Juglans regia TaxID=2249226 RepID=UPI001B7F1552|nr:E3 ubiquitin-protein ligase RNF149-like [Juglans microcarpa x Juglans regia]
MMSFLQLATDLISLFSLLVSKLSSLSAMSINYIYSIATNLKWTFNFLLYHAFSKTYAFDHLVPEFGHDDHEELIIERYQHKPAGSRTDAEVQCAVCLCKMEDGDEFRVLRCEHPFHRVCLDRWTGRHKVNNNQTCPLCRDFLAPARMITELGVEVLSFKFYTFRSDARETWWLR